MKSFVLGTLGVIAAAAGIVALMLSAASIPDVHTSYASGECVKVINYTDDNYSCENMPTRYNNVWVK